MKHLLIYLLVTVFNIKTACSQSGEQLSVDIPNPQSFYVAQKYSNWCWAACNQMLLNAKGIEETQDNQVVKLYGQLVNMGAGSNYENARRALAGTYLLDGNQVRIVPYVSYLGQHNNDAIVIINQLNKGIPLVMATAQHGRVCVGVDYLQNGERYQITRIRLLNPASDEIEEFTMNQFLQMGLIGFMTYKIQ